MVRIIPLRFDRVAAAFDEAAKAAAGVRLCESIGSEHSPAMDLSDLVNSFIEKQCMIENGVEKEEKEKDCNESDWSESETKDILQDLLGKSLLFGEKDEEVKQRILTVTETACRRVANGSSSPNFKRSLMSSLRDSGFDAGLCKSRWEKTRKHIAGVYEYVDVIISGTRYIIEVNLAAEFEIAKPTSSYISLLGIFPWIFVGKSDELKPVVGLMCRAIKKSMKREELHVPPWRRNGYMQSKWFASYKRKTNEIPGNYNSEDGLSGKRWIGFEALPTKSYHCKDDFGRNVGLKVGYLAAALNGL
ncbi:hypothetical protein SLEP1_g25748 [Rubroshorea leprosula]|uniref:Uncharacterized protein n=1 Tax=Rubroshorea leprosula TaxID=152421 RepID=A0AAV5JVQ4_9ROSI|nr:hypothetical protein SLEP1_g25748 [Rubroshorea leprosula]